MEVERITNPGDVTTILNIDDTRIKKQVLDKLDCSKIEWIQMITKYIEHDGFMRMWGVKEDGNIKAYMIAINCVQPPISRSIAILYQSFFGMKDEDGALIGEKAFEKVKEWAMELGARNIVIQTDKPRINSKFGFQLDEGVCMVYKL